MADPALYPNVAVIAGWSLATATFAADILETDLTKAQFEQQMRPLAAAVSSDRIDYVPIKATQIRLSTRAPPSVERFITPSHAVRIARMMKTKAWKRDDKAKACSRDVLQSVKARKVHERVMMDRSAREAAVMEALMRTFEVVDLKVQSDKYRTLIEEAEAQIGNLQCGTVEDDLEDVEYVYKLMSDYQPPAPEVVNRYSLDSLNKKRTSAGKPPLHMSDANILAATDEFEEEFNIGHFEKWATAKAPSGIWNDFISWKISKLRQEYRRLAAERRQNVVS